MKEYERPPSYAEMQHHHEPDVPTWFVLTVLLALMAALALVLGGIAWALWPKHHAPNERYNPMTNKWEIVA